MKLTTASIAKAIGATVHGGGRCACCPDSPTCFEVKGEWLDYDDAEAQAGATGTNTEKGNTMEIINYLIQNGQTELTTLMGIFGIDVTLAVVQTDSRIVIEFSMLRGNLISV